MVAEIASKTHARTIRLYKRDQLDEQQLRAELMPALLELVAESVIRFTGEELEKAHQIVFHAENAGLAVEASCRLPSGELQTVSLSFNFEPREN